MDPMFIPEGWTGPWVMSPMSLREMCLGVVISEVGERLNAVESAVRDLRGVLCLEQHEWVGNRSWNTSLDRCLLLLEYEADVTILSDVFKQRAFFLNLVRHCVSYVEALWERDYLERLTRTGIVYGYCGRVSLLCDELDRFVFYLRLWRREDLREREIAVTGLVGLEGARWFFIPERCMELLRSEQRKKERVILRRSCGLIVYSGRILVCVWRQLIMDLCLIVQYILSLLMLRNRRSDIYGLVGLMDWCLRCVNFINTMTDELWYNEPGRFIWCTTLTSWSCLLSSAVRDRFFTSCVLDLGRADSLLDDLKKSIANLMDFITVFWLNYHRK